MATNPLTAATNQYLLPVAVKQKKARLSLLEQQLLLTTAAATINRKTAATICYCYVSDSNNNSKNGLQKQHKYCHTSCTATLSATEKPLSQPSQYQPETHQKVAAFFDQHNLIPTAAASQQQQLQYSIKTVGKMLTTAAEGTTSPALKVSHRKTKCNSNNINESSSKSKHKSNKTTAAQETSRNSSRDPSAEASATTDPAVNTMSTTAEFKKLEFVAATKTTRSRSRTVALRYRKKTSASATALVRPSSLSSSWFCSSSSSFSRKQFHLLPSLGATSFLTLLTLVCLETVLLSTVTNCAKTFYMHWNTSNSIFRIDNTDHIIDVNKGNLAFEFDQVHIICPVYEPGTFENDTEKYIIYNVSKVEYETCRITNADPRVIAICDKPQKLMFFTITFRPFTPQPGGLEFLPGNDYYFISTSSKDDLYRRIGGRCSTNNMKVVFKVCCAPEEKNKTIGTTSSISGSSSTGGSSGSKSINGAGGDNISGEAIDAAHGISHMNSNQQQPHSPHHMNNINTIGNANTAILPASGININSNTNNNGIQLNTLNGGMGGSTSINTNIDQFNRIPMQPNGVNVMNNNIGGVGPGSHHLGGISNGIGGIGSAGHGGIMLTPGGGINMIPNGGIGFPTAAGGGIGGHIVGQTGIRINNVPSHQYHPQHKNNYNNNNHNAAGDAVASDASDTVGGGGGILAIDRFGINTNHSNIVQSTMNFWPDWHNTNTQSYLDNNNNSNTNKNYYESSYRPTTATTGTNSYKKPSHKNDHYDKHPNEVVKNEELTYNSAANSIHMRNHALLFSTFCWRTVRRSWQQLIDWSWMWSSAAVEKLLIRGSRFAVPLRLTVTINSTMVFITDANITVSRHVTYHSKLLFSNCTKLTPLNLESFNFNTFNISPHKLKFSCMNLNPILVLSLLLIVLTYTTILKFNLSTSVLTKKETKVAKTMHNLRTTMPFSCSDSFQPSLTSSVITPTCQSDTPCMAMTLASVKNVSQQKQIVQAEQEKYSSDYNNIHSIYMPVSKSFKKGTGSVSNDTVNNFRR